MPFAAGSFLINLPQSTSVAELVNDATGRYFLSSDPLEEQAIMGGSAGPGWRRTGFAFAYQFQPPYPASIARTPVCRFYAPGPGSHFFTANEQECEALKDPASGWVFEKIAFTAVMPVDGACPAGFSPIHRLYNNRWMFNDSSHRFTYDDAVRRRHLANGWIDEGIAFCGEAAERAIQMSFRVTTETPQPRQDCAVAPHEAGGCVVVKHLPVGAYSWATRIGGFGLHVDSRRRTGGDYTSVSLVHRFATNALLLGGRDERVIPWARGRDVDLFLGMQIGKIQVIRRGSGQSHAYGLPLLEFTDMSSGRGLIVTVQTYGTVPPGDFVARDAASGNVIVSTVFRAKPLFGRRIHGDFIECAADAAGGSCPSAQRVQFFRFAIGLDDFAEVLRLARGADPQLSPDPADYRVDTLECRNETYGDAEIGLLLGNCTLEVTY